MNPDRIRAAIRSLYPDEMTPTAKNVLERILDNEETEAPVSAGASDVKGDGMSEQDAAGVSDLQKVIYGYFGPAYKINTYKTPEQQDRELAEAIWVAGYRKIGEPR